MLILARKSKYLKVIDHVYKYAFEQFFKSLENFIGSLKMYKYNLICNEKLVNTCIEPIESYKYLIYYLTNIEIKEKIKSNFLFNTHCENKYFLQTISEINSSDIDKIQIFYELKNHIKNKYEEGFFSDNDITRFILGFANDIDKIKFFLEEFYNFKKNIKDLVIQFEENVKSFNLDFNKLARQLCVDKLNRPVIYFKMQFLEFLNHYNQSMCTNLMDNLFYHILIVLESAFESMSTNIDKILVIIDLKNFSISKNLEIVFEGVKKLTNIFDRYYPERLSCTVVINRGYGSSNFFKKVVSLISSETFFKKLKISNNHHEDLKDLISEDILNNL